jgi:HlyD family secretion protein
MLHLAERSFVLRSVDGRAGRFRADRPVSVANLAWRCAGLLASAALVVTLASCTGGQQPPPRTDVVQRATITAGVSATGALSAVSTENLGFSKGGKLTSVRVRVGDHVSAGQVLATVDDYADRQVLKQQKANLAAQEAALARIEQNPSVSGAQDTVNQANTIVSATKDQAAATQTADNAAIHRARRQLADSEDAKDQASDAVSALKKACKSAKAGSAAANARISALMQQALQQLQAGDVAGAAKSLAQLLAALGSASSSSDAATACSQVPTAEAAETAAKQRIVSDRTALVAAEQKKNVDAAAGRVAVANAEQAQIAAQNTLNSASSDRPFNIEQQRAVVAGARVMVQTARKDVEDTVLRSRSDGTVSAINGVVGEFLTPSTGTTALAPGSKAAIPGTGSAGAAGAAGAATGPGATTVVRPAGSQFLVLSNVSRMKVVLPFEESDAAQIKPGQNATVRVDSLPNATFNGTVEQVAPSATAISGVVAYFVTVNLDSSDPQLKDGQTARGTVLTVDLDNVLSVANAAIRKQGNTSTVIVIDPSGNQRTVTFQPGAVGTDRTEVLSGLTEGQRVLLPAGSS